MPDNFCHCDVADDFAASVDHAGNGKSGSRSTNFRLKSDN